MLMSPRYPTHAHSYQVRNTLLTVAVVAVAATEGRTKRRHRRSSSSSSSEEEDEEEEEEKARRVGDVPAWEMPREDFDAIIASDIGGVSNVVRHFVPRMIRRGGGDGGGTLVVVSPSDHPRRGGSGAARHAAACAIGGLMRCVALSMPHPHRAATLSLPGDHEDGAAGRGGTAPRGDPGGGSGEGGDDHKGGDVDFDRWAEVAVAMILRMDRRDNGTSMCVPGF
jgi:NAD(P)-dependent dehydrogenase (short-subunit alcohol dehydrogenase family)